MTKTKLKSRLKIKYVKIMVFGMKRLTPLPPLNFFFIFKHTPSALTRPLPWHYSSEKSLSTLHPNPTHCILNWNSCSPLSHCVLNEEKGVMPGPTFEVLLITRGTHAAAISPSSHPLCLFLVFNPKFFLPLALRYPLS